MGRVGSGGAGLLVAAALLAAGCAGEGGPGAPPAATTPPAAIPAEVKLPNEGERSTAAEFTDWTTDNATGQPWLLDPCRPTAYPTDAQRVGFRTVSRSGPEAFEARQLAVYPSPAIAAEAVAGFRRALTACRTGGSAADGGAWQWVTEDLTGVGDEGFLAATTIGGPGFAATGQRIAVTRAGAQVFLAAGEGEFYTAEIDEAARAAQQVAETFLTTR